MITSNQVGTTSPGKLISGPRNGRHTDIGPRNGRRIDVGEPIGDPVQHGLQKKPYEHCDTKQRGRDPADRAHYMTGGV
jgi:hypothetical protein